jgi:hypothetical protein
MSAARKLYTFGPQLVCEPARRIVDPTPAEVLAFTRRPAARQNRGRIATVRSQNPTTIVTSVPVIEWWRADYGVSVGATLTWTGMKSGTVATQTTAGKLPTYSGSDALFNGRPSFTFDGVNDEILVPLAGPAPGTSPRWYLFVLRNIAIAAPSFVLCGAGAASHIVYRQGTDAADQLSMFNGAKVNTTSNATVGAARRVAVNFTNSVADYVQIGSVKTPGASALNGSCVSLALGGDGAGSACCNYALAEFAVIGGEPSVPERAAIDAYLTGLYGSGVLA